MALDEKQFSESGLLHVKGYLSKQLTSAARDSINSELERLKIKANGKIHSAKLSGVPMFNQTALLSQMVKAGDELDRLFPGDLVSDLMLLAAGKLKAAHPHPQLLLSLPQKEEWSLAPVRWHLDLAVPKLNYNQGIQVFVLIDDVLPRGGGTLAIAGSHRLHYVKPDTNAHGILKSSREFSETPETFFEPQMLHGVRTQIVEMCGRAGDVYVMDLRVLHSPSLNSQKNIRMMATNRYVK